MMLRMTPITSKGEIALREYINSCITPTLKDKMGAWKAKKITQMVYKGIEPPKMLREEFEDNPLILSCIVEDNYIQYTDTLLETAKNTYLKLFKCSINDFDMRIL